MRATYCLFRSALAFSVLLLFLPAASQAQVIPSVDAGVPSGSTDPRSPEADRFQPSANALQAAHIIGVEDLVTRISSLQPRKTLMPYPVCLLRNCCSANRLPKPLLLHLSMSMTFLIGSTMSGRKSSSCENVLRSNRDRAVGTTSVATLAIGTGLGVVSGVLQFSDSTKGVGNVIGFAAGGISTLLSFHSIRQQRSGKRPAWVLPDMLSPFFGVSQQQHAGYPNAIWAYLNSTPPGTASQASRRERILADWLKAGRFSSLDSPGARQRLRCLPTPMRQTRSSALICYPNARQCSPMSGMRYL